MRVGLDQQRGYCRDELGRCERLAECQTVGDAFRWPIGRAVTADIDLDERLVLHQQKRLCRRHPLVLSSTRPPGQSGIEGNSPNSPSAGLVPPSNVRLLTFGPKEFHIHAPLTKAVPSGPHDNLRQSAMRAPFRGKEFEKAARGSVAGGRDDRGHNRPGGDRVERLRLVRDQSGFRHRSPRLRFLRWFQACAGAHADELGRRRPV